MFPPESTCLVLSAVRMLIIDVLKMAHPLSLHVLTCLLPSLLLSGCMLCPPLSLPHVSLCVLEYAAVWISGCPHEQRMYPNGIVSFSAF